MAKEQRTKTIGGGTKYMLGKQLTMKAFILTASFIVSIIFFGGTYFANSYVFERSVKNDALQNADTLARVTFNSMFQIMSTGWTRPQLMAFLTATREMGDRAHSVDIYRGDPVVKRFGPIEQAEMDQALRDAMYRGQPGKIIDGNQIRYVFPLKAQERCLGCHTNAHVGEVLGAIDVHEDTTPLIDAARRNFFFLLALIAPVPFLAAFLVTVYVNKKIDRSIELLEKSVEEVNSVSDLKNLAVNEIDFGFAEINAIFGNIGALSDKLRSVAVDRDLLEFEIRLLEKFIITSDVVKDWHEYVGQLLAEISKIVNVYALFSVFRVDDELLDVDIFWRYRPIETNKKMLEGVVRAQLAQNTRFSGNASINHHMIEMDRQMEVFGEHDLAVKVKSLLLETPKIGGIVGIGVHIDITKDETRALVVESILSTLLNVIGSVKAIYKYTKDLEYFATRDPLTQLYNQRVFWELLAYEVLRTERHANRFSLFMIDLDNFKMINDTHGHAFGDRFLESVAGCIHNVLRSGDVLARYAGDEFVIILPEADLQEACLVASRILESTGALTVEAPDGTPVKGTVSIGVAVYPDHATNSKDLFLFADNMMYKAKADGKGRAGIPTEEDMVEIFRNIGEKSMIVINAVEGETIVPYFQPILDIHGDVQAVEVLSRIAGADGRMMEAGEFVEIAEKVGVIHKLDYIVLEKVMRQVRAQHYEGYLFINISPRALILSEFTSRVKRIINEYGISPAQIVFEITERDTIKNLTLIDKFVGDLKLAGFRFAIDDFGSGFSSFHYLKRFPIDFLKIEGEFIANMAYDGKDRAFVRSIAALAHDLGIRVIGEHVESEEVMAKVIEAGIDFAQGYYIGRPSAMLSQGLRVQVIDEELQEQRPAGFRIDET